MPHLGKVEPGLPGATRPPGTGGRWKKPVHPRRLPGFQGEALGGPDGIACFPDTGAVGLWGKSRSRCVNPHILYPPLSMA